MKTKSLLSLLLALFAFTLSSCELVGDLVEFGVWIGVIIVVVIIAIVLWIVRKIRG